VFSSGQRKQMNLDQMLDSYLRDRVLKILNAEKREWDQVNTVADWERFRDVRLQAPWESSRRGLRCKHGSFRSFGVTDIEEITSSIRASRASG